VQKVGVVVHGPEVIDSGSAQKVLNCLKRLGEVTAVLGGTMGRLAIIDNVLQDLIKLSPHRRPSETVRDQQSSSDIIVILCQSKTKGTGLYFGSVVAARAASTKPLVQVDCGGKFVAPLTEDADSHARIIADLLSLDLLERPRFNGNVDIERSLAKRRIIGVQPGELISINGTVVARATDCFVEIHAKDGKVVDVIGAKVKLPGIEKLSKIDLENSIIRSGDIRRTESMPLTSDCKGNAVVVIDHSAEDAFNIAKGACLAVTIGDDTTAIAGDILYRLGIPVTGIVDGDLDQLSHKTAMFKGSTIIQVVSGHDDIIGRQIKLRIFDGGDRIPKLMPDLLERIVEIARPYIVDIKKY
jgi:hypothetical protein